MEEEKQIEKYIKWSKSRKEKAKKCFAKWNNISDVILFKKTDPAKKKRNLEYLDKIAKDALDHCEMAEYYKQKARKLRNQLKARIK